jgi:hypothetical protein
METLLYCIMDCTPFQYYLCHKVFLACEGLMKVSLIRLLRKLMKYENCVTLTMSKCEGIFSADQMCQDICFQVTLLIT